MTFNLSRDDFSLWPRVIGYRTDSDAEAWYYGYRRAWLIYFLWWELSICLV